KRSGPMGTWLKAAPSTTTTTASTPKPEAAPISVERQPRVAPTPITIVTISIASTAEARKVVIRTATTPVIVRLYPAVREADLSSTGSGLTIGSETAMGSLAGNVSINASSSASYSSGRSVSVIAAQVSVANFSS